MVTMDVCMPIREPADKTEQDLEVPKPGAVNFTRSDSGIHVPVKYTTYDHEMCINSVNSRPIAGCGTYLRHAVV